MGGSRLSPDDGKVMQRGTMTEKLWATVDRYIDDVLVASDPALDAALAASTADGLPQIAVSPSQGKLLHIMARAQGARRILEIGTLGGYSTIWLARALPSGGRLITLEADAKHADVARANIARAGLSQLVDLRLGEALTTLPALLKEGPFDLVFIDADKENNPSYFQWALKLTRKGSLIVVDNVVRDGRVADKKSRSSDVVAVRRMFDLMAAEPSVEATAIQTVGSKGYDGLAFALVIADPT
jgi:predicted O-methyltransferase YrrM